MAFGIDIQLKQISRSSGEPGNGPSGRVLFAFAAKSGDQQAVVFHAPSWSEGNVLALGRPLFSGTSDHTEIAIALLGLEIGSGNGWAKSPLAEQLAEARAHSALSLVPAGIEPGSPWDDGLEAIRDGLAAWLPFLEAQIIFDFSKVYQAPPMLESHTLCHTVGNGTVFSGARYKLVLTIEGRQLNGPGEGGRPRR